MPSHTKRRDFGRRSSGHAKRRRGSRGFSRAVVLLVLTLVLLGAGSWAAAAIDFTSVRTPSLARAFNEDKNAIWLAHTWVGEAHSEGEIGELVDTLAARGFRYIYVHAGPFDPDGTVPAERYRFAKGFLAAVRAHQPNIVMLAWLGGLNKADGEGDLDLTDSQVRQHIATTAQIFVRQDGWDGIHLDIEPMPTGRRDFLTLLEELRSDLGIGPVLSVAGQRLWVLPVPLARLPKFAEFAWDEAYLHEVADRVNQVAIMTYDSSMPKRNLYIQYQRAETIGLIEALAYHGRIELLVGVPTYSDRRPNFQPEIENMATGLQGVIEALGTMHDHKPFVGVSLYAHWTTSDDEWRTYERMWLRRSI